MSVPDFVDSGGEFASGQPESVNSPRISDSQYQSGALGKLLSPEDGPGCLVEGDSPELAARPEAHTLLQYNQEYMTHRVCSSDGFRRYSHVNTVSLGKGWIYFLFVIRPHVFISMFLVTRKSKIVCERWKK